MASPKTILYHFYYIQDSYGCYMDSIRTNYVKFLMIMFPQNQFSKKQFILQGKPSHR